MKPFYPMNLMELLSKSFGVYNKQIFHEVHLLKVVFYRKYQGKYKYDFNLAILLVSLKFGRRNRLLRQRSSRKDY